MKDSIYTSIPINSTAKIVTSQSNIPNTVDKEKEELENLVVKFKKLENELLCIYNSKERYSKEGKLKIVDLKRCLTATRESIHERKKIQNIKRYSQESLERNFINVAKDILDNFTFNKILNKAKEMCLYEGEK